MKPLSYALIVLLVSVFLLSACSGSPQPTAGNQLPAATTQAGYPAPASQATPVGYPASGQPNPAAAYPPDGIVMQVIKADGKVAPIDFKGLTALARQKVTLENKEENVSKLSDVLSLGGVTAFTKVTVTGSNGTLELSKDQVAQAYVDVPANGLVRLLVQGMPANKWLTGVSGVRIQ